jgi:outer membrane protein assembly factor BamB
MQWSRTFGGSGDDTGWSVYQTADGGYIIVGVTNSFGAGRNDVYIIKTDSNGNLQWSKTLGSSEDDVGFSVQQTDDGGYIIAGGTNSSKAGYDVWLIKLKSSSESKTSAVFPLPLIALLIPLIYRGIAEHLGSYAWRNRSTGGSIEKVKNLTRK